jgi:hypothetical protein
MTLFIIVKIWKQPLCPFMDELGRNFNAHYVIFGNKIECDLAVTSIWKSLEDTMLSE